MLASAASEWEPAGVTGEVLAVSARRGSFAGQLEARGYVVRRLTDHPLRSLPIRFGRLLSTDRPDVVHLHAERGNFWLAVAGRLLGVRVIRTVHAGFDFRGCLRWERWLQRSLLTACGVVTIAVSPDVAANERRRFRNRCVLIENWIDSERFELRNASDRVAARERLGVAPGAAVVVTVGNCAPIKRHDLVIAAMSTIRRHLGRDVTYLHLGEETNGGERQLTVRHGVAEHVRFLGAGDPLTVLQAADVFVMPSDREGVGLASVEALAVGVPVVITDVPGLRDLAVYGSRVRVAASDVAAVAAAVAAALTETAEPDAAAEVSAAVRRRFGVQRGVREHAVCYRAGRGHRVFRSWTTSPAR